MPSQVQLRRGTTAQNAAFTGAAGELSVNTTSNSLRVHNGSTAGGFELARADMSNVGIGTTITVSTVNATNGAITSLNVGYTTSTNLNVTGITSISGVSANSGIVTSSTTTGIVTYYGDASNTFSARWTVTASVPNNFNFVGTGFTQSTADPILYLARGLTYQFVNNSGTGGEIIIKSGFSTDASLTYNDGVIGNGTTNSTITFTVPYNAPNTLYYMSNTNTGMGNTIVVFPNLYT